MTERSGAQIFIAPPPHAARKRYEVLALITIITTINFLDRTVMGIAGPNVMHDLHASASEMGWIFSAFSWTYICSTIPAGMILDRFGARRTLLLSLVGWSACTFFSGITAGLAGLMLTRLALGVCESPSYLANTKVVSAWFPQQERALATGIFSFGIYAGIGLLSPLVFTILHTLGWRALFLAAGLIGLLFSLIWYLRYRDPVSSAEGPRPRDMSAARRPETTLQSLRWLLRQRQVLGVTLGTFGANTTIVFFFTWFPTYMTVARHMGWIKLGFYAMLPFLSVSIGQIMIGWISDVLIRRGRSLTVARKLPIVVCFFAASCIAMVSFVRSDTAAIALFSLSFFMIGCAPVAYAIMSDVVPTQMVGTAVGLITTGASVAGILTPLIIGHIVQRTGSFNWALIYVGGVSFLTALNYLFVVGPLRALKLE